MITKKQIINTIADIEKEKNIKILFCVEAGSRAWGFESLNSDYDIRYIYINTLDWYLSISEQPRETLEYINNDLDIVGWELRRSLRLLKKSNPSLLEWLNSDIVYYQDNKFMQAIQWAADDYYRPRPLLYHYLHMAIGNIREYLKNENEVWIKKYLYVIRPLMACNWIELYNSIPPVNFEKLYATVIQARNMPNKVKLLNDLNDLVLRKKQGDELSYGAIIPSIHDFIKHEVERLSTEEKNGGINWPKIFVKKETGILNDILSNTLRRFEKMKNDLDIAVA